ncbi:MAG: 6,7-dimethyl-8-ribityllumazine synthase [Myxococcota bacterium]
MTHSKTRIFEGDRIGSGLRFGVVVARFNSFVTQQLVNGALDGFRRHGVEENHIDIAWVPGAFEIPLVAKRLAHSGEYHGIVCLGCVIRGGTPHFEYVATSVTRGVAQAAWDSEVPVVFGVLTTDTLEQAIERAGCKAGNKGFDAAVDAIEMAQLLKTLPPSQS